MENVNQTTVGIDQMPQTTTVAPTTTTNYLDSFAGSNETVVVGVVDFWSYLTLGCMSVGWVIYLIAGFIAAFSVRRGWSIFFVPFLSSIYGAVFYFMMISVPSVCFTFFYWTIASGSMVDFGFEFINRAELVWTFGICFGILLTYFNLGRWRV